MKTTFLACCAVLLLGPTFAFALEPFIFVDVSFKALVSSTGRVDPEASDGTGQPFSVIVANQNADALIAVTNQTFAKLGRGFRVRRVGDVQAVVQGANGGDPKTDQFFPMGWGLRSALINEMNAHPVEWKKSSTACNFYLVDGLRVGVDDESMKPPGGYMEGGSGDPGNNTITAGNFSTNPQVHEFCHWLGLAHTFLEANATTTIPPAWLDDGYTDTLVDCGYFLRTLAILREDMGPVSESIIEAAYRDYYATQLTANPAATYGDLPLSQQSRIFSWLNADLNDTLGEIADDTSVATQIERDCIAAHNFTSSGTPLIYSELTANQKAQVDTLRNNIVSYHAGKEQPVARGIVTEQQLDSVADTLATTHVLTASGKYIFVGATNTPLDTNQPVGRASHPYPGTMVGLAFARNITTNSEDRMDTILITPGAYSGTITLDRKGTYRARTTSDSATHQTEQGHVTLGSSTPH